MLMDLGIKSKFNRSDGETYIKTVIQPSGKWAIINIVAIDGGICGIIAINRNNPKAKLIDTWGTVFVEMIDLRFPRRIMLSDASNLNLSVRQSGSRANEIINYTVMDRLIDFLSAFKK